MLSALIRVHGKEQQDISSIIPVVVQKKSAKAKAPKENDKKVAANPLEKKPRKPRTKKAAVQPEDEDSKLDYSKFVPLKASKKSVPTSYKVDEDDNIDGDFMPISCLDDDDGKYEDIDKMYRKQDVEWVSMMEEAMTNLEDPDGISDVDVEGSLSNSQMSENDIEGSIVSESATLDDLITDIYDDCDNTYDNDMFFEKPVREQAEKKLKVYKGPVLFKDADYIP